MSEAGVQGAADAQGEAPVGEGSVADVYKDGVHAASLTKSLVSTEFRYRPDYLASDRPPVATSLPKTAEPVHTSGGAIPAFFAGLLPEGRRLSAVRRAIKASADDELSLLLAVGADVIGDVQVIPGGTVPSRPMPEFSLPDDISEISLREVLASSLFDPVALPGVQDKVSGQMINLPASRAGERLIVKLDPPEYPHVVQNEAAFLTVARAAGLPVSDWRLVRDSEGVEALLVSRFDRVTVGDLPVALGCEDATQVIGLWPADKYSPSYESVVTALASACAASPVAVRELFTQIMFAVLTGNGDVHAKNLSILCTTQGEWRVSPAYDVVSTSAYGDNSLALRLDGVKTGISRKRALAFAAGIGLPQRSAVRVLDTLLVRTAEALSDVSAWGIPYTRAATAAWQRELDYRRRLLSDPS